MITNFRGKNVPKEKATCKSLLVILLDSVIKVRKRHYPQIFWEECKYKAKKIKIKNVIDNDFV